MASDPRAISKSLIVFFLVFGAAMGFVTAAVVMSFWSVIAGEETPRGLFILVWMLAAVIFFAWPLHLVARIRAVRAQRQMLREQIGDLDFEPPAFPMVGIRAPGPKLEGIQVKAPDIGDGGGRRFLSRGRTAEQRMADYLKSLELKAEMERAKASKSEAESTSEPLD